jgi:hypothetical protein
MAIPSRRRGRAPSGIGHPSAARKPPPGCGEVRRARLPGLRAHDRLRHADTDAGVDRDRAVGQREHRVEVELGDGGKLLTSRARRVRVEQRSAVGRGRAPEAATRRPGLAAVDELGRVDVRQRGDPEDRLADQLGEDAAGTEGDERARRRGPGRLRRAARRRPSAWAARSRASPILWPPRRTASSSRGRARSRRLRLVGAGSCGLDDRGEADARARRPRPRRWSSRHAPARAAVRSLEQLARRGRVEPRVLGRSSAASTTASARHALDPLERGHRALRAPQPGGAVGDAAERARGGLRVGERRDACASRSAAGVPSDVMITASTGLSDSAPPTRRRQRRDLVGRRADGGHEEHDARGDVRVGEDVRDRGRVGRGGRAAEHVDGVRDARLRGKHRAQTRRRRPRRLARAARGPRPRMRRRRGSRGRRRWSRSRQSGPSSRPPARRARRRRRAPRGSRRE